MAWWDGNGEQAIVHLEEALALAQEMGLAGEEWPILSELGKLYSKNDAAEKSEEAFGKARAIIGRLADTLDDEVLKKGFLTAAQVSAILN